MGISIYYKIFTLFLSMKWYYLPIHSIIVPIHKVKKSCKCRKIVVTLQQKARGKTPDGTTHRTKDPVAR